MTDATGEIAALVHAYAERIDDGDFEGVAELLAEAELRTEGLPGAVRGREAILELYRRTTRVHPETGTPRTAHLVTNLVIEVDEVAGTARARSHFAVLQATPSLPLQVVAAGRYRDRFVRGAEGWRFRERVIRLELVGDVREHLLLSTDELPRPGSRERG